VGPGGGGACVWWGLVVMVVVCVAVVCVCGGVGWGGVAKMVKKRAPGVNWRVCGVGGRGRGKEGERALEGSVR
jgi:hypothetical protein